MSVLESYATWRKSSAARPYLYNSTRPTLSLVLAVFAYIGGAYCLTVVLSMIFGQPSIIDEIFSKPYLGLLAAWIAACSWWGERRNWRTYVVGSSTEMMIGPVAEIGEQK